MNHSCVFHESVVLLRPCETDNLGIPLPASTQWDIVEAKAEQIEPAFGELIRQAADGDVVFNDDTTVKILEMMGQRAKAAAFAEDSSNEDAEKSSERKPERRGLFTSGIVSTREGRKIALFFSGRQHAGENLKDVLLRRAETLAAPIQMCDALSRNLPAGLETIVAHCLAHGRRQFVDVAEQFPEECRYVLESLSVIYRNDAIARQRNLSPSARRHFHQSETYVQTPFEETRQVAGLHGTAAKALKKCDLPPAEVAAWCKGMIGSDRVGFIYDEELRTLQNHFEASRS